MFCSLLATEVLLLVCYFDLPPLGLNRWASVALPPIPPHEHEQSHDAIGLFALTRFCLHAQKTVTKVI